MTKDNNNSGDDRKRPADFESSAPIVHAPKKVKVDARLSSIDSVIGKATSEYWNMSLEEKGRMAAEREEKERHHSEVKKAADTPKKMKSKDKTSFNSKSKKQSAAKQTKETIDAASLPNTKGVEIKKKAKKDPNKPKGAKNPFNCYSAEQESPRLYYERCDCLYKPHVLTEVIISLYVHKS